MSWESHKHMVTPSLFLQTDSEHRAGVESALGVGVS